MRDYIQVHITEEPTAGATRSFTLRNKRNGHIKIPFTIGKAILADDVPEFIVGLLKAYDSQYRKHTRKPLTLKQRGYYTALLALYKEHGRMPTYQDVADKLGLRSRGSVFNCISKLATLGWVWFDDNGHAIPYDIALPEIDY